MCIHHLHTSLHIHTYIRARRQCETKQHSHNTIQFLLSLQAKIFGVEITNIYDSSVCYNISVIDK